MSFMKIKGMKGSTTAEYKKRFYIMLAGVFFMGFFLSFLIDVDLGTDPCTFMNYTLAQRMHLSFGTWQLILNIMLLIICIIVNRHLLGPGTIANMVFIGYIADFFRWVWSRCIPDNYFTDAPYRYVIFAFAILLFVISASFYMNSQMGLAPYDALSYDAGHALHKIPFHFVRIAYDLTAILIGFVAGGRPNIGTVIMAFALGPMITAVGRFMNRMFPVNQKKV